MVLTDDRLYLAEAGELQVCSIADGKVFAQRVVTEPVRDGMTVAMPGSDRGLGGRRRFASMAA